MIVIAATIVKKRSSGVVETGILLAIAVAISARMATGVSWGIITVPGLELVNARTALITQLPNSINPIPPEMYVERSPEKMRAAKEISTRMTILPITPPAMSADNSRLSWNSCKNLETIRVNFVCNVPCCSIVNVPS